MVNRPIYKLYEDIRDEGNLTQGMLFGNGKQTIKYTANGDATDWMATQNDILAISPELGIKNKASNHFLPHIDFVQPIVEQNFPWINYTLYKLSAQIDTKIIKFERVACMIENCTTQDHDFETLIVEIMVENLGLSGAANIEIKVITDSDIKISQVSPQVKGFNNSQILKLSNLNSLESKSWKLEIKVPSDKWEEMNKGNVIGKDSQAFLTLENMKYPHFGSSQKNTRTLSKASIMAADNYIPIDETTEENNTKIYYLIGFLVGFTIIVIAIIIYKRRKGRNMLNLDGKQHRELEMQNHGMKSFDGSEDGRI